MSQTTPVIRLSSTRNGEIARLVIDTGSPANGFTMQLLEEFHAALDSLQATPPRVLIIAGRPDNFSRGADLKAIPGMGEAFRGYVDSEFNLFGRIDNLPFVTIAALTGTCIGNAAELALACDFRIATASSRFSLPETAIGFIGPSQRLARYVGIGKAKEMLLLAQMLGAEEALRLGLLTRVVPDAALEAELATFANDLADRAPLGLAATKRGIALSYGTAWRDDSHEREWAWNTYVSEDGREGFASVLEKRKPVFKGR